MKTRSLLTTGLVLTTLFSLSGCGGGGDNRSTTLPDPELRFINVSLPPVGVTPGTDLGVDVVISSQENPNALVKTGVPYPGATTDFESLKFISDPDGAYDTWVRRTGQTAELDREYSPYQRDTDTIVSIIGLQDPAGESRKRARVLFTQVNRKAPTGNSRIYFLNAFLRGTGFDTPLVTLQNIDPLDPNTIQNPSFKMVNVDYTATPNATIPPGPQTMIVRRADTDALVEYARTTFTFEAGKTYFAIVHGQEANAVAAYRPKLTFFEVSAQD